MPEKIEVSTKFIALITAIITLVAAILAFKRNKRNIEPQEKIYKGIDSAAWEIVKFFAAFMALGFLFLLFIIGMKWGIVTFSSIK